MNAFFLALVAGLYWTLLGAPLARRVLPRDLPAMAFAPLLGFCVHVAIAAPLLGVIGFSTWTIVSTAVVLLGGAWLVRGEAGVRLGVAAPVAAGVVALVPMVGVLAKGERLSGAIFDHAKIALVDAIARLGLPVVNPFYGAGGHFAYYWWWHFAAAELARVSGVSGWRADAALTGVTAFAVLLALAGVAEGLGRGLGVWAVGLAVPASLRWMVPGGWLAPESGLGGLVNQASWAPQHVMGAGAVVLAVLVVAGVAEAPSVLGVLVLAGCVAAGFGCSAWVGGVVAAVVLPLAALVVVWGAAGDRVGVLVRVTVAGVVAMGLVAGLLMDEHAAAAGWGHGAVRLAAYPVFGAGWWDLAGLPVLLGVEFPVACVLGGVGVWAARRGLSGWRGAVVVSAGASLVVMAVGRGALVNNDLGWRAALVPMVVLVPFAAWFLRGRLGWRRWGVLAVAGLGLVGVFGVVRDDLVGRAAPAGPTLAAESAMWRAVRGVVGPEGRVLSDPRLDGGRTIWAADIGWALLADRSSCFAGWAAVRAFAPMSGAALGEVTEAVDGAFDGGAGLAEVGRRLGCDAVLVTAGSGVFGRLEAGRLVAEGNGWRVYGLDRKQPFFEKKDQKTFAR